MKARIAFALLFALISVVLPGVALAHGDIQSTEPADGAHPVDPPTEVRITFTEAPTGDSRFEVEDGCGNDVLAGVSGEGPNAVLEIDGGSTGAWTVRYRVISSVDGHPSRGNFGFLVGRGPLNCDGTEPDDDQTPDGAGSPPPGADGPGSDDGDFPVVPILLGGAAIVAIALAVRMFAGR
jgi:methionine-rich copper-binding protein CopC